MAKMGMRHILRAGCVCLLAVIACGNHGPASAQESFAEATYDPRTGRITIQVQNVAHGWRIESLDGLMTGPDNPFELGVLPAGGGGLGAYNRWRVGEFFFGLPASYGPIDLGKVAQPNIPPDRLVLYCQCQSLSELIFPILYVPESSTLFFSSLATLVGLCHWRVRGMS
jgi:hypothetical protein